MKPARSSQTRWLSIEAAITRILTQWGKLKCHFNIAWHSEKCYADEMLHIMYSDETNHAYFLFLRPSLTEVQLVSKPFQLSNANLLTLMNDLSLLIEGLAKKTVLPTCRLEPLSRDLDSSIDPKPHLGYEAEKKTRDIRGQGLTSEAKDRFREDRFKFLRHPFERMKLQLLNNINITRQAAVLSSDNTLQVIKESLIPPVKQKACQLKSSLLPSSNEGRSHWFRGRARQTLCHSGAK